MTTAGWICDAAASPGPAGAVGYCMSGQFAINAASRHPERVGSLALLTVEQEKPLSGNGRNCKEGDAPGRDCYV